MVFLVQYNMIRGRLNVVIRKIKHCMHRTYLISLLAHVGRVVLGNTYIF